MSHKIYDKTNMIEKENESDIKKRFFVPKVDLGTVEIDGEEHNHIANVMRFKVGDDIILIADDEFDYYGTITEIKKNATIVNVTRKVQNQANPNIEITAFVAMNKREPMTLIVRMLSELGVTNFVPIITKWTLSQDITDKMDRYQKIANQSAKQCRRSKTMKVEKPIKLAKAVELFKDFDIVYFAYENEDLQKMQADKNAKKVAFVVGPVAGFDRDEAEQITKAGAISISLGKRILKADTATIMLASLITDTYDN